MAMQQEALEAIRKANNPGGKPSVYTLRGRNEALGPTKDLAHEGFGTYEDKFSENPLSKLSMPMLIPTASFPFETSTSSQEKTIYAIPARSALFVCCGVRGGNQNHGRKVLTGSLLCPPVGDLPTKNVLRDEQMQYILPNRTSTRRILLTKKLLALGAEFDVTNEVLNGEYQCPCCAPDSIHHPG